MGIFDFISQVPPYNESPRSIERLNKRHQLLIDPFANEIKDARVLDLGAHDGRWSYALAQAGAAEVVGIEARKSLIDLFDQFPDAPFKKNVRLYQGDMFEALEELGDQGDTFDLVACYGIFYHIMDHLRLLTLIHALSPQAIFIDGEFSLRKQAVIDMVFERTDFKVNAAPQVAGQDRAIIGIPSVKATTFMARSLGYDTIWADPESVFGPDRAGVDDYFRKSIKRRRFCTLIPTS